MHSALVGNVARKTPSTKRTSRSRPKLVAITGGKAKAKTSARPRPKHAATKKELAARKRFVREYQRAHGKLTDAEVVAAAKAWLD